MPRRPPAPSRVPPPSDQLAELIRGSGRTPAQLADMAEVAPSVLSRFLSGERGLNSQTFDRIAAALGGLHLVIASRRRARPPAQLAELPTIADVVAGDDQVDQVENAGPQSLDSN